MAYLFWLLPILIIVILGTGIYQICRKCWSRNVIVLLIVVSSIVLLTSPVWVYLLIILFVGWWNIKINAWNFWDSPRLADSRRILQNLLRRKSWVRSPKCLGNSIGDRLRKKSNGIRSISLPLKVILQPCCTSRWRECQQTARVGHPISADCMAWSWSSVMHTKAWKRHEIPDNLMLITKIEDPEIYRMLVALSVVEWGIYWSPLTAARQGVIAGHSEKQQPILSVEIWLSVSWNVLYHDA